MLGTEFTAYAREAARVVLKSGKIELEYKDDNGVNKIKMKPGDLFENFKKKARLSHVSHPETFSAWKNDEYVFENTSLLEITKFAIRDTYIGRIHVSINDPCNLTMRNLNFP